MKPLSPQLPDMKALTTGLKSLVGRAHNGGSHLTVLRRRKFVEAGSFASELVTCRLSNGSRLQLLCKYTSKYWEAPGEESWGHRRGVLHEAAVYRDVLRPLKVSAPRFYGTHTDPKTGETWLVLEYLPDALRVNQADRPGAMGLAARWIGEFHALAEARLRRASFRFLRIFDAAYYRGWPQRTLRFAGPLKERFPWLRTVCQRFEGWAPLLLSRRTVIHGEYYGRNVLFQKDRIYPVDWESAAIAAGELDLASLTEGWPASTVRQCQREYQRARWPQGAPADFPQTLEAARVFTMFRWLGDSPEITHDRGSRFYFRELRTAAERLGLLP